MIEIRLMVESAKAYRSGHQSALTLIESLNLTSLKNFFKDLTNTKHNLLLTALSKESRLVAEDAGYLSH